MVLSNTLASMVGGFCSVDMMAGIRIALPRGLQEGGETRLLFGYRLTVQ